MKRALGLEDRFTAECGKHKVALRGDVLVVPLDGDQFMLDTSDLECPKMPPEVEDSRDEGWCVPSWRLWVWSESVG